MNTLSANEWLIWFIAISIVLALVFAVGILASAHMMPHPHFRHHHNNHLPH